MSTVADDRRRIAAQMKRSLWLARHACGPAEHYAKMQLIDLEGIEPIQEAYCCQRGNGWEPTPAQAFPRLLERSVDRFFVFRGQRVYYFRFELRHCTCQDYNPKPQEELDAARAKREQRKREREAAAERAHLVLFADQLEESTA